MRGKLTIIPTDGEITERDLDRPVTLAEMQAAVGGYIETVPYWTMYNGLPCVAFCDEEGKIKERRLNILATGLWGQRFDVLVGPVLIVQGDAEFMEAL